MTEQELLAALFRPEAREDPGALLAATGLDTCRHAVVNAVAFVAAAFVVGR